MLKFEREIDKKWLNRILDFSGVGLWEIYIDTNTGKSTMYGNERMMQLLGIESEVTPEECYEWWYSRVDDNYKSLINNTVETMLTTDNTDFELEYPWYNNDDLTYVRCRGGLVEVVDGVMYIAGYHHDISEHYETRVMLQKQLLNFEISGEIGNYAVFEMECSNGQKYSACTRIFSNKLLSSFFGYEGNITNCEHWFALSNHFTEDMAEVWRSVADCSTWEVDEIIKHEMLCTMNDGTNKWLSLTYKTISEDGLKHRLIGHIKDISESKEREKLLQEAKLKAEQASETKGMFLANMSHEIRTPMNAIINFAKFLQDTQLDDTQRNYAQKILSSSKHMLTIINDILDFSKIEANQMIIEHLPFSTHEEIENIDNIFESVIDDKELTYVKSIDPQIPTMLIGDAARIRQVLINMIGNATKFTSNHGIVQLSIDILEDRVDEIVLKFAVTDTGIGISNDDLSKLFSAFSQVDASITRRYGGTGLGLVNSKMLVEMMGGEMFVESSVGVGSTFWAEIPFRKVTENDAKRVNLDEEPAENNENKYVRIKCLIAEDNLINQEVIRVVFTSMLIEHVIVSNGQEALDTFLGDDHDFDCIFMDLQMPIMDGYTATKAIRSSKHIKAKTIPIFALTANAMQGDAENSLKAGMDAHFTKPLSKNIILDKLVNVFPDKVVHYN